MNTLVFAADIRDLAVAFKTMCEANELTSTAMLYTKRDILEALDETIEKYRSQLKEESKE